MIVALASLDHQAASSRLADELAALRASAGSKVILISRGHLPTPADWCRRYDDVLIDTSGIAPSESAAVLAVAAVIVVLVLPSELAEGGDDRLLARIRCALDANPRARVLVVVGHAQGLLSPHEVGNILVFVARIGTATLADTLVLDEAGTYHARHSEPVIAGDASGNRLSVPEIRHLYRQVFTGAATSAA